MVLAAELPEAEVHGIAAGIHAAAQLLPEDEEAMIRREAVPRGIAFETMAESKRTARRARPSLWPGTCAQVARGSVQRWNSVSASEASMSEAGPVARSADTAVREIVIVGAGAAGLAAAADLARTGRRVLVLEARGRPGGRIHTLHDAAHPLPIELGAEFMDVPGAAWEALRRAGGVVYRSTGGSWEVDAGRARLLDIEAALEPVLSRLAAPAERDQTFLEFLRERCDDLDARDREAAQRYVEGFHAADIDRVGVRWLAETVQNQGGGAGRVQHHALPGFDAAIRGMLASSGAACDIRFNTVAREIRWTRRRAELRCSTRIGGADLGTILARRVLVAVPLGVLQAPDAPGGLHFRPELPARKRQAIEALTMGSVQRVTFRFREPFWEETLHFAEADGPDTNGLKFLVTDGAFPTWWTPSPVLAPVLVGWSGGGAARKAASDSAGPVSAAVRALARMLALRTVDVERYLEDAYWHDWDADPFARGAYSYIPAGALDAQHALSEPVEDVLFFAGEATARAARNATVDGAIRSGWRAAAEIRAADR